ncbi:MAG TPA: protein-methionine-sulfoxide reductase heme-binding subunit MsrQ, partial [Roseiflexaceae bacterium]|nr:protein-methionine-sulfoxide reductase heme-binding subunit MsrQ [Roseiflexaceae bacterium]
MQSHKHRWLHLIHPAALAPLAVGVWDFAAGRLSVNPIQDITHRSGYTALVLLVLSLACTPLSNLLGLKWAARLRRPLGLYAFLYATIHMLIFAVLDYVLDWGLIWQAVVEKRYIVAGFGALLLLVPLAVTSTRGWQRRLGRHWKALHRLVYVAAPLAVIHFVWLVKSDYREPLLYGAAVALLLCLRLPAVRRRAASLRARRHAPPA